MRGADAAGSATLGEILDKWCTEIAETRNVRDQTKRMYGVKTRRLAKLYGGLLLEDLRPGRLQSILNDMAQQFSAGEYALLKGVLNRALNYAVMTEAITANYISATERPRLTPKGDPVSLNAAQVQVFRNAFAEYVASGKKESNRRKSQLVVEMILGLGGLRISEVLAIRHMDVDFERNRVDINGTVVYKPGVPVFRQDVLKAERQKRELHLNADGMGMRALRAARDESAQFRSYPDNALVGRVEPRETEWINPAVVGDHFDNVTWRKEVIASLAETGLVPEELTPRTLRRSVATLVSRKSSNQAAADFLGHNDTRVTISSYITPEGKVVDIGVLDDIFEVEAK